MGNIVESFKAPTDDAVKLAEEVRGFLVSAKSAVITGAGGGMGCRDMWAKIAGKEYFVSVKECDQTGSMLEPAELAAQQ